MPDSKLLPAQQPGFARTSVARYRLPERSLHHRTRIRAAMEGALHRTREQSRYGVRRAGLL